MSASLLLNITISQQGSEPHYHIKYNKILFTNEFNKDKFNDLLFGFSFLTTDLEDLQYRWCSQSSLLYFISTIGTLWKHSLLVLSYWKVCLFLLIVPPEDRDHTDSRRIKPNSRTLLMGEQPNPSKLHPPEDRMNRHRGANQPGQCVLSPAISLLSLA